VLNANRLKWMIIGEIARALCPIVKTPQPGHLLALVFHPHPIHLHFHQIRSPRDIVMAAGNELFPEANVPFDELAHVGQDLGFFRIQGSGKAVKYIHDTSYYGLRKIIHDYTAIR
jgi:hypothetical protein